jgi:uncharacterized membrane protein YqaE (UPF0057 family)
MKKFTLAIAAIFMVFSLTASVPGSTETEKTKTDPSASTSKEVVIDNAVTTDAMREFKSLSRVDRKARIAQAKTALKEFKAQKAAAKAANMAEPSTNTVLLVILAILLPPLAVALHEHGINGKFWLDLLLTLLFFLPGVIYALIVVLGNG